jgi:hypothetical protein
MFSLLRNRKSALKRAGQETKPRKLRFDILEDRRLLSSGHLVMTTAPPSTVTAGVPFGMTYTAMDWDRQQVATSFNGIVVADARRADPPEGPIHVGLYGTTRVTAVNGVAVFSDLILPSPGTYGVYASDPSLGYLTFDRATVTGTHEPATHFELQGPWDFASGARVPAGEPFDVLTAAKDAYGNWDDDWRGDVTLALDNNPTGATLRGTLTKAASCYADFPDLTIDRPGRGYTLRATGGGLSTTSKPFDVTRDPMTLTWTGNGDGKKWSDPKNWDGRNVPFDGDTLVFPSGVSSLSPENDLTGLTLAVIDIQGSGYDLTGNAITLTDRLISAGDINTYELDTTLSGMVTLVDETGDLWILADFSGDGGLVFDGDGEFTLMEDLAYTGPTFLDAGITLNDWALDALDTSMLTIGTGSEPVTINCKGGSSVTLDSPLVFQDGASLVIGSSATSVSKMAANAMTTSAEAAGATVTFTGSVKINGKAQVVGKPTVQTYLNGVIETETGGEIKVEAPGTIGIWSTIRQGVKLDVTGGTVQLFGTLESSIKDKVTVSGGTLVLKSTLKGQGGIQVGANGVLTTETGDASGCENYFGTVTVNGGTIEYRDGNDDVGLGSGLLTLKGGKLVNMVPELGVDPIAQIDNNLVLVGDVTIDTGNVPLILKGFTITAEHSRVSLTGASFLIFSYRTMLKSSDLLTFIGAGAVALYGTVTANLFFANVPPKPEGPYNVFGNAMEEGAMLVLSEGAVGEVKGKRSLYPLAGEGEIRVKGGRLLTDTTGCPQFHGEVLLDAGSSGARGVIEYYDSHDADGLGTGTLHLNHGTLQNMVADPAKAAKIGNPVAVEGTVTVNGGPRLKLTQNLSFAGGTMTVHGELALLGSLVGQGAIVVDGGTLDATQSSDFKGSVDVKGLGKLRVPPGVRSPFGTAKMGFWTWLRKSPRLQVSELGDPILDNPITVHNGTLTLEGSLTFPQSFTVNGGATLDLEGAGSQVVLAGPLAGSGTIVIGQGTTFSATGNTKAFKGTVKFQGGQAAPAIVWPTPAAITYGTALGSKQLNAKASFKLGKTNQSVPGTFAYSPPAGTVLGAGSQTLSVTFTPKNQSRFTTITDTVTINVNKAKPKIRWSTPAAIAYGTPLGDQQLNAIATWTLGSARTNVAGTFTYTPPAGTVLTIGKHTLSVLFTPADTTNYTAVTGKVALRVNKPRPVTRPAVHDAAVVDLILSDLAVEDEQVRVSWLETALATNARQAWRERPSEVGLSNSPMSPRRA